MRIRTAHACLIALTLSCVPAAPALGELPCAKDLNQAPLAGDDEFPIWPATGVATALAVLANDEDPEGEALTVISVTQPGAAGTVTLSGGQVRFTAASGHSGAQFQYTVSDPQGATATATVRIGPGVPQTATIAITCAFDRCNFTPNPNPPSNVRSYTFRIHRLEPATGLIHERLDWTGAAYFYQVPGAGSYRVDLTVNYHNGAGVPVSSQFRVTAPAVQFTMERIDAGDSLQFDAMMTSNIAPSSGNVWFDWGDGVQQNLPWTDFDATGPNGSYSKRVGHRYANPGLYHVRVVVTPNGAGGSAFEYTYEIRNKAPQPVIEITAIEPGPGYFRFDGRSSNDEWPLSDRPAQWSWGDGSYTEASLLGLPTHRYAEPGTFTVTLTVTDIHGLTGFATATVEIPNTAPAAELGVQCYGRACSMNATRSRDDSGRVESYTWRVPGLSSWTTDSGRTSFIAPADGRLAVEVAVFDGSLTGTASRVVQVRSSPAPAGLAFYTIAPCRLFDSRNTTRLGPGIERRIAVAGQCGIPAAAQAVEANFIVVAPDSAGHLVAWASGTSVPPISVLNYAGGAVIANNTAVRLGGGAMSAVSAAGTHLIVDVSGYYAPVTAPYNAASVGPLWLHPIEGQKIYSSVDAASPLVAGTVRRIPVAWAYNAVPASSIRAVFGNLHVLSSTGGGHIEMFGFGENPPPTSAINFPPGRPASNETIFRTSAAGFDGFSLRHISYASTHSADVQVDPSAVFTHAALKHERLSSRYHPIEPCRALDTRDPAHGYGRNIRWYRRIYAAGNCGIPANASAVRANFTVVNPEASAALSVGSPFRIWGMRAGETVSAGGVVTLFDPVTASGGDPGSFVSFVHSPLRIELADLIVDYVGYYAPDPADKTP